MFTLVIWAAAWGVTVTLSRILRPFAAVGVAALGTALFWRAGEVPAPAAFAVPFVLTVAAVVVQRRMAWGVAAVASGVYAALLWL